MLELTGALESVMSTSCIVSVCPEPPDFSLVLDDEVLSLSVGAGGLATAASGGVVLGCSCSDTGFCWGVCWSGVDCSSVCTSLLESLCSVGCVWMMCPVGLRSCTRVLLQESRCEGEESLDEASLNT